MHAWDDLGSAAGKAEAWFGRWRPLPAVLRWLLEGERNEEAQVTGAPGSPFVALLSGYVAMEIGDRAAARELLEEAVALHRDRMERDQEAVTPEQKAWVERVERDAAAL